MVTTPRWSTEQAQAWYDAQSWPVGANFYPSTAGNQLEMWQADTFDPQTIDRELGYAADIGMNMMRVYLHDLVFHADRRGLFDRMDQFLTLADKHGIATMFVFLDDCWNDEAKLGPQPEPIPGVHNSIWLRCPANRGVERAFHDAAYLGMIRAFVCDTLERFGHDPRVAMWDLYNEPQNDGCTYFRGPNGEYHGHDGRPMTTRAVVAMLNHLFDWVMEVDPSQPATVGVYTDDWSKHPVAQVSLNRSDVPTFHCYGKPEHMRYSIESVRDLAPNRPTICTEYMSRGTGSTFADILPILQKEHIGAIHWGLVAGRSNTIYPWASADEPGQLPEPKLWHHDLLRADGSAFDPEELSLFRRLT